MTTVAMLGTPDGYTTNLVSQPQDGYTVDSTINNLLSTNPSLTPQVIIVDYTEYQNAINAYGTPNGYGTVVYTSGTSSVQLTGFYLNGCIVAPMPSKYLNRLAANGGFQGAYTYQSTNPIVTQATGVSL